VEHQGVVSSVIEPSNQPALETEVTQHTKPPNFIPRETLQTFKNARIQDELKLSVGGRKEVLLDRYQSILMLQLLQLI
jgi:hypothetical protein